MVYCKVIYVFKDYKNKIYGYRIQDMSGNTMDVEPLQLKDAVNRHEICLTNMKLTSDNRLIPIKDNNLATQGNNIFRRQIKEHENLAMNKARQVLDTQAHTLLVLLGDINDEDPVPYKEMMSNGYRKIYGIIKSHSIRYGLEKHLFDIIIQIKLESNTALFSIGLVRKDDTNIIKEIKALNLSRPLDSQSNIASITKLTQEYATYIRALRSSGDK